MKIKLLSLITVGLMALSGVANAITTANLADLIRTGGSLAIGDKTFSGFGLTASGALNPFNPADLIVTASIGVDGTYYLTFDGGISVQNFGDGVVNGDLLLEYNVTASGGLIASIDQRYVGGANNGAISVDESAMGGSASATSHLQIGDVTDGYFTGDVELIGTPDQLLLVPPQVSVHVEKDINLTAGPSGANGPGFATLSVVEQSFHQTGLPDGGMTLVLLGAAVTCVGFARSRMSR